MNSNQRLTRLKELRKAFKMTQQEVAKCLHIHQSEYGNIEVGKRNLTVKHLVTLALMYNVTTDYILGLSNDPNPR